MNSSTKEVLTVYHNEVKAELDNILSWWMRHTLDTANGGFMGCINENNIPVADAPKGSVLNSRILWAFSSAYSFTQNAEHKKFAHIAFNYLENYFIDKQYGGVFWAVDSKGLPLDTKKQVYALAFAIYGCTAYYRVSNNEAAKNIAITLFEIIEKYSFDPQYKGYFEAFKRDWSLIDDLRLSEKDANEKKTMNTHLHVLEAYSSLYRIWPDPKPKAQVENLITNFSDHIVDKNTGHLCLFFDEQWNEKSGIISYGHDIEAAWLLMEAAECIQSVSMIKVTKDLSLKIAEAATEGLDKDGGLWYECDTGNGHYNKEKHWWVQAEAMVGFLNTWQLTNDIAYLHRSLKAWGYVKEFMIDKEYGEWLWGRAVDGTIMPQQDKAGIWKCPYHNSRACIEIMNRLHPLME